MAHIHSYDKDGNQLCCTQQEKKIYTDAGAVELLKDGHTEHDGHDHGHDDDDGHDHAGDGSSPFKMFLPALISLVLIADGHCV